MSQLVGSEQRVRESQSFTKRSKHILLFSPFFFPEIISTGRYNTYLARALAAQERDVDVVASHPLYPDWNPKHSDAQIEGLHVHRGGAFMRYPKTDVLRRLALELWYAIHSIAIGWARRRDVDVAVFIFPPILFAIFVRMLLPRSARVVSVVHDLQGLMMSSGIVGGRGVMGRVVLALEGYVLRRCDSVICLSRSMSHVVSTQLGVDEGRCVVCYPFANTPSVEGGEKLSALFEEGRLHVVYSGALGYKQVPDFLLAVFGALCRRREDIVCHLFSRGPIFDRLVAKDKGELGSRVRFHDLVPEDALGELYRRSGIQVIPQASGTGTAAFPSKLPNLLAAGVPVFSICDPDSELAQVTLECGGAVSAPDDVEAVVENMSKFIDEAVKETHEERRVRLKEYTERLFSVERVVEAILGEEDCR